MNNADKASLIKELKGAFVKPEEKPLGDRLTFESISVDKHVVSRITNIKQPEPEEMAYAKNPDSYVVRDLANLLNASGDNNAVEAASILKKKFLQVASYEDPTALNGLLAASKDMYARLSTTPVGSAKRAMTIVFINDQIAKL